MPNDQNQIDKYNSIKRERQRYVEAILLSQARHKVVVAGPGTGKSHLFKEILREKKKALTLTFINALVADLALDLCGLSEVRTLHGFARSTVAAATNSSIKIFSKLSGIIRQDSRVLLGKDIDFDSIFNSRQSDGDAITFYKNRQDYYDKYYGHSDVIFEAVNLFEKDREGIPSFDQIVVDEFQDFNQLEVSLIELLQQRSPTLLVGDDDQALYDFKNATADFIRGRFHSAGKEQGAFLLPYCSRSTRVIVDAVNDIVGNAARSGYLRNRIDKPYLYFEDPDKDAESNRNPSLIYTQLYAAQIPWYIEERIKEIAEVERGKFSVLTISPIKMHVNSVVAGLRKKGFENVQSLIKSAADAPTMLDGLSILLNQKDNNLGWRIVCALMLDQEKLDDVLWQTAKNPNRRMPEIINAELRKEANELVGILRKVRDGESIEQSVLSRLFAAVKIDPYEAAQEDLKHEIELPTKSTSAVRNIPIRATTVQSSKGLADQYVFITHFDDRYFIRDNNKGSVSDRDICSFLVALTRARRKVFLISTEKKDPIFLKWIRQERIARR